MNQYPNTRHCTDTDYSSSVTTKERGKKKKGNQGTSRGRGKSGNMPFLLDKKWGKINTVIQPIPREMVSKLNMQ